MSSQIEPEKLLTVAEFAKYVGYSEWSVRKFCRQGLIKARRRPTEKATQKGLKILIPISELDRFTSKVA
ncbi:helix-turn-helix domain-containing protein [Corynebacterium aurimucosum]|uniref:helix-turn-helix domain-containing protein n=1 Tax=Corynebacterium aurimucosum TaxID=169292 RepID=UPI00187A7964|nr:helix-turn-helix domain-containing protein [Corynebacterium aurimucosum]MBE7338100.1 helix-turn-helix domain-containing protein [Corynebacterium aurimucosum]